ncbi:RimK family alpha-L-glutamate ligase [Peptoniphilus sp. KCTC 25270]|uniref:ATP-grasp domain-containing protein n=1 Tax=Peptoniphilus sp. KCTC 25270 TaxID=2897414 RepID=UPI001E3E4AFA|nr:RimK family alpha-L-glutamate ligase [Peptoniphilus sp. KCTC 25270]MCD1147676.1 RimK family alpha-L-glutamate ligase [Peptoniphilus sp. KCTC 25270]
MKKGIIVYNSGMKKVKNLYGVVENLVEAGKKASTECIPIGNGDFVLDYKDKEVSYPILEKIQPDFVLFLDKDLVLARGLEAMGYPIFNSPSAIEICDNKLLTWQALKTISPMAKTLPGPMQYSFYPLSRPFYDQVVSTLGSPFILKEAQGSFGEQVYSISSYEEMNAVLSKINGRPYLFQENISHSFGRDIRVVLVGDEILGAIERRNPKDFRANIALGGTSSPIVLTEEQKSVALEAHRALGLQFSGVDLLYGEQGPLVCEVNSNLSYLGFQQATGIPVGEKILSHILSILP